MCYSVLESTGELIRIKRGETGYYQSGESTGDRERNLALAEEYNSHLGVDARQREAMEIGSLFGWTAPGADPAYYEQIEEKREIELSLE